MKIKILIVTLLFISYSFLYGMGTWIFNNRSHGEVRWSTIKTKNFDVHYHDDIFKTAISFYKNKNVYNVKYDKNQLIELPLKKIDIN